MNATFLAIDSQKQQQILNAAMEEFTRKGYKLASTNQIVQVAGISKGLLFHYFTNKKGLFLFLYDYCLNVVLDDFFGQIDYEQQDILLRLREILLIKFQLISKYPLIFDFLIKADAEDSLDIREDLNSRNQAIIQESYKKMFAAIDESLFRPDIDIEKAKHIAMWTIKGFSRQLKGGDKQKKIAEPFDDKILKELNGYLDTLKKILYS
ncbi:TetR family transcriptional regulator [Shimazuella alba]|uniref:TetR family transcriptional regulator n=1 Tax=Shimazuella alba TaxID=2690964 RepID=A0A6I4VTW7_9BACL|nr:TetR family transcriptional regulator [Shimazuella alba]